MNVAKTLERIRYRDATDVSLETLRGLQRAFLLRVPFENLDIRLRRHIAFTPEAVYQKIVGQGRGGFCYELNSLFHDLLRELGFNVNLLAATMIHDGRPGTVMGHLVLKVELDGRSWLADVGNGKSFREPLNMDGSNEHWSEGVGYRIGRSELGLVVLQTAGEADWIPRFMFADEPRNRADFLQVCEWTQSSPDSRFTQRQICTLALPDGRITLLNDTLTIERGGTTEAREILPENFERCIREQFGMDL